MKVLFTSHTANFCKFNRPFMRWFKEQGWQVDYACACEEEVSYTYPYGECGYQTGCAPEQEKGYKGDLYGTWSTFFQRSSDEKLAIVLPNGKAYGEIYRLSGID